MPPFIFSDTSECTLYFRFIHINLDNPSVHTSIAILNVYVGSTAKSKIGGELHGFAVLYLFLIFLFL